MSVALTYPSISGVSGAPNIPAMSDVADIQTALKYLYYGSTATENVSNGIYGLIYNLKQYVDASISGINVHEVVKYASTATIAGVYAAGTADASGGTGIGATITYSATGTQYLDGAGNLLALNQRVLIKNGVTADAGINSKANGIYVVTTAPAVGVAGVLTRATDSDNSIAGEMGEGDFMFVADGSTLGNTSWILTSSSATGTGPTGSIKIGTDPVTYQQYSGVGTYYIGTTAATVTSGSLSLAGISGITGYSALSLPISTADNVSGTTTALSISTGAALTTSGNITISTGAPSSTTGGVSGNITISTPAGTGSGSGASGSITISTGNGSGSGGGAGNITLNSGSAVTTGTVKLADTVGNLQLGRTGLTISVPGIINTLISGTAATNNLWAENSTGTIGIGTGLTTGTLTIGGTSTINSGSRQINIATGSANVTGTSQTINIGTAAPTAGATSSINIGASGTTTTIAGTLSASAPAGSLTGSSLPVSITSASGLATVGTITSGTWNGSVIDIARGGTNSTATPTNGGIGYGTGTAHAYSTAGSSGQVLTSGGAAAPVWTSTLGSINTTNPYTIQPTPSSLSTTQTITTAQMLTYVINTTSATPITLTLPTGTSMETGIQSSSAPNGASFDWYIANSGAGTVTISSNTSHTLTTYGFGTTITGSTGGAQFRTYKNATNAWTTLRLR